MANIPALKSKCNLYHLTSPDVVDSIQAGNERGYEWIRKLKQETGKNIPELLALKEYSRDPFFVGSETDLEQAEWFEKMWEQEFKGQTGIHLRRVHYRLGSIGYLKPDGTAYTFTKLDWGRLTAWSRVARYLKRVPADAFEDHRAPEPYPLSWQTGETREPVLSNPYHEWELPSVQLNLSSLDWSLGTPSVAGYDPDDYLDRAYYIELWIEKSTMDDILVPLANELGFRLVPSIGFQSISNAVRLLERVQHMNKPTRVFYISDYDAQGLDMPTSVARQLEFWRDQYAPGSDVKLTPLALTAEQVERYHLPMSEDQQQRVELDALEALVPGELAKMVRQAVAPYLDDSIAERLAKAKQHARQIVRDDWNELMEPSKQALKALEKRVKLVTKKYQREAKRLNQRLAEELKPFVRPVTQLQSNVRNLQRSFRPDLPARPAQEVTEQDEADWLFDSARSYLEQLAFYKVDERGARS